MLTLDEDDLILAILTIVDFVRRAKGDESELRASGVRYSVSNTTLKTLLSHALQQMLVDFKRQLGRRGVVVWPSGDV